MSLLVSDEEEAGAFHTSTDVDVALQVEAFPQLASPACKALMMLDTRISLDGPVAETVPKVRILDEAGAADAGVAPEVRGPHAQHVAGVVVVIVVDIDVIDRGVVILLLVGEGLAVKGIVGPCAYRVSAYQHTVGHLDVLDYLLLLVGVRSAPWDEGDGLSCSVGGVDVAVGHLQVSDGVVGLGVVLSPGRDDSAWVAVAVAHHDAVVVRVHHGTYHPYVPCSLAEAESVAAHTLDVIELDVAQEEAVHAVERRVIVVASLDVDVRGLQVLAVNEGQGDDVDAVGTYLGIVCPVGVLCVGVVHADDAWPGHPYVLGILGHHQRHVDVEAVGPWHAWDVHVVTVIDIVSVVAPVGRLPQDGTSVQMQLHVALQAYLGGNVSSSVSAVVASQHHASAASGVAGIDGPVDGLRIVGEGIAPCSVVADVKVSVGQAEGVGVRAKVLPVLHVEAGTHLHCPALLVAYDGQHAAAEQRYIPVGPAVGDMADAEALCRGASVQAREMLHVLHSQAAGLGLLPADSRLGEFLYGADGGSVEVHRCLVNLEDRVAAGQFRVDMPFHPHVLRAGRTAVDGSGKVLDGLLFLEIDAVEEQCAARRPYGFEAQSRQPSACSGQVAQVGIVGLLAALRLYVDDLACLAGEVLLPVGEKPYAHLADVAPVLHHHEDGVIDL